ncbi:MAG: hypothetical protein U0270_20170 [Labilithrix sp.]
MRFSSAIGLTLTFLLTSAFTAGCTTPTEETESAEAELSQRLPPASAAPVLDTEELAFVNAMNAYRKEKGLEPFEVAIGLVTAARKHSQELADLNAPEATHNDRGLGDSGPLRRQALKAARARINRDYPFDLWGFDGIPGPGFGEDCKRRADIGAGTAAFAFMRRELAETIVPYDLDADGHDDVHVPRPGFGEVGIPMDDPPSPNMLATYFTAMGVARAKSRAGVWYWTVTYGMYTAPQAPMLSLDEGWSKSLLTNGSFEEPAVDEWGHPTIRSGSWSSPGRWYGPNPYVTPGFGDQTDYRVLHRWHVFASAGGRVDVRTDNAYFLDETHGSAAHGLRIIDSSSSDASASATQLVRALPGVNYELTARARRVGTSADEQFAYLDFTDEKYDRIAYNVVKTGSQTAWTGDAIRVSATAPPKTAYVRVILFASGGSGTGSAFDWDDVRLRAW